MSLSEPKHSLFAAIAATLLSATGVVTAATPPAADAPLLEPAASAEDRALRAAVDVAIGTGRLRLSLPGGKPFEMAVKPVFRDGFLHLRGGGIERSVNLVMAGHRLYGEVWLRGRAYRVARRDGLVRLLEAALPAFDDDSIAVPTPSAASGPMPRLLPQRNGIGGAARQSIDVLAYLDTQVTAALGANGARASWLATVDLANVVLGNSLIADAAFRTVGFVEYTPPTGTTGTQLAALQRDAVAQERRNAFGADLGALYAIVREGATTCGNGYLFGAGENADGSYTPFSNNVDFAFSANGTAEPVGDGIGCGALTVVHEFGHNLGAHHSRTQVGSPGGMPFRYSAGERCGTLNTSDIMSNRTFNFPDDTAALIYSTPLVSIEGQPCGVAESVDNARAVNETFDFASAYRSPSAAVGALSLSPQTATVSEADESVRITLVRDGDLGIATSVEVAAIGDSRAARVAEEGRDFDETVVRVDFAVGVDRADVVVPLRETGGDQGTRALAIVARYPIGLLVDDEQIAAVSITDTTPAATISVQTAAVSAAETAGTATFRLSRSNSALDAVAVDYVIGGGSATAGVDYVAASGTVNWAAGDTAPKNVVVALLDDTVFERIPDGETVNLSLSNPQGGAALGEITSGTLTITDNEVPVPGTLSFGAARYSVDEGGATATVTVIRSGGADGAISVGYASADGTAAAGTDYMAAGGTLNWADLDNAPKSFTVAITEDSGDEPAETLGLSLAAPTGGATLGVVPSATLTIVDNDEPPASGGGSASPLLMLLLLATSRLRRRRRAA